MRYDGHIHMVLDGVDWKAAISRHRGGVDTGWIRRTLAKYRDEGFSYLRDGGDKWGVGKKARELAPEYGIIYRTPLSPLCMAGHYGSFIGKTYENWSDYGKLIRENREEGADFIKIMISGLMDFNSCGILTEDGMRPEDIREAIHIAHDAGFAVMAHANGTQTVMAAAEAGVDSVEHGAYLNREVLCAMKEHNVIWCPTLSTIGNLRGKGRFNENAVERILESARENVKAFSDMGGLLAVGTDAGAWAVPHGSLSEYELLEEILGNEAKEILKPGALALPEKF